MQLFKEIDVLDTAFRKLVIDEITGDENQTRKAEHYKRWEIYHDRVAKYTEDLLKKQFDNSTVEEMKISLTNVSLCKKIIDKIARVYSNGVVRDLPQKREVKKIEFLVVYLCVNSKMKKANRYLKLHNNIWVMCLPKAIRDIMGDVLEFDLKLSVLPPFLFDVIEDSDDRESAKCLVLSNYMPKNAAVMYDAPERTGQRSSSTRATNSFQDGDGKDQTIADTPMDYDPKNQRFTFWTDNFHFVCNSKGETISGPVDSKNPIGVIPGIALNKDQDGEYYSIGGNDLVDSCLLTNAMITNINHIGIQQGYGQAWMRGKNLPQQVRLGPTKVIKLEASGEGENPEFGFATSNAPLGELKEITVMQLALLLSTNNLSTSGVKVSLDSGMQFPSGIAMMIDKAESTEDVKDQAQIFIDNEPRLWDVIVKWLDEFEKDGLLVEKLKGHSFLTEDFKLKINDPSPMLSESEKLSNLQLRKDLGISTEVELLQIDDPSLTDAEAEKKLLKIAEEKMAKMAAFSMPAKDPDTDSNESEDPSQQPPPNGADKGKNPFEKDKLN